MIKLINIITQIILVLGCCAILIFTLSIAIASAKNDFATITNIYDYIYMLNVSQIQIISTKNIFKFKPY